MVAADNRDNGTVSGFVQAILRLMKGHGAAPSSRIQYSPGFPELRDRTTNHRRVRESAIGQTSSGKIRAGGI